MEFLSRYLRGEWCRDPVLCASVGSGSTVLVSPSYHYALASSLGYTLLRAAIVAERLGGEAVYMGGDEGLLFVPAWLPWGLAPTRYRSAVAEAAGLRGEAGEALVLGSPAAVAAALLPRILWGVGAAPGFHPVKPGGRGETLYRVPALIGTGVSVAVRLSHYRDHVYSESAAAEHLLEEAKEAGGSRLAVSMGRAGAARPREAVGASAVLPLLPSGASSPAGLSVDELRGAARLAAAAAAVAGAVAGTAAGKRLTRAHLEFFNAGPEDAARLLQEHRDVAKRLAAYIAERYASEARVGAAAAEALRSLLEEAADEDGLAPLLDAARMLSEASTRSLER